jgi:hypothetical protein
MTNWLTTLLLAAAVATPAAAQVPGIGQTQMPSTMNLAGEGTHLKTDVDVKQEQEKERKERAYKAGMSKIPDQKAKNDPWGTVRTTPPTASNQRPAAK